MILSRLTVSAGVAVSAAVVIAAARPISSPATPSRTFAAKEVHRIQLHLDSALALLDGGSIAGLSAQQRTRRTVLVQTLRAYRNGGVFPHNYDFAAMTPYFVDRKTGTLCAVAYLLESTGRGDIVARVAGADNNVRVRQLAGDTVFTNWLDENGLSLAEAAFIQVVYARDANDAPMIGTVIGTVAMIPTLPLGIWNLTTNSDGHRKWVNRVALVAGLMAIGGGAQMRVTGDNERVIRTYANTSMAVGATGAALAIHSMVRHSRFVAHEREAARRAISDAAISPIVSANGSRTGMAVSFRF